MSTLPTILIVDDDEMNIVMAKSILEMKQLTAEDLPQMSLSLPLTNILFSVSKKSNESLRRYTRESEMFRLERKTCEYNWEG